MLRFYYTGALNRGDEQQTEPSKSLGGLISTTVIPNNSLGNVLPNVSLLSKIQDKDIFRAIALKNETGENITNLDLWLEFAEESNYNVQVGAITPALNKCGYYEVERLSNQYSFPYSVEFYSANGEDNAVGLGNLKNNEYIVLFLKCSLTDKGKSTLTDSEIEQNYLDNIALVEKESVGIKIRYDIDDSISASM